MATGATVVAPKFSGTLTLSQPRGQILLTIAKVAANIYPLLHTWYLPRKCNQIWGIRAQHLWAQINGLNHGLMSPMKAMAALSAHILLRCISSQNFINSSQNFNVRNIPKKRLRDQHPLLLSGKWAASLKIVNTLYEIKCKWINYLNPLHKIERDDDDL